MRELEFEERELAVIEIDETEGVAADPDMVVARIASPYSERA